MQRAWLYSLICLCTAICFLVLMVMAYNRFALMHIQLIVCKLRIMLIRSTFVQYILFFSFQTWEDPNPNYSFKETNTNGDNDPLDVCEIGEKVWQIYGVQN
jgi:hypothetical protein